MFGVGIGGVYKIHVSGFVMVVMLISLLLIVNVRGRFHYDSSAAALRSVINRLI